MPELPDLILLQSYFNEQCAGQTIHEVEVSSPKILFETSADKLNETLKNRKFKKAQQHGKYLFLETTGSAGISVHFGMTGTFTFLSKEEKQPPYTSIVFHLNKGLLYYSDRRKIGKVGLCSSLKELITLHKQGPDALHVSANEFIKIFQSKKGKLKPTLMDQSLVAGLGNVYTDEILFQAKIHPESSINKLDEKHLKLIHSEIAPVLQKAVSLNGQRDDFPKKTFLISNREEGAPCPRKNGKIHMKTIGGRSTFFCNECQELF